MEFWRSLPSTLVANELGTRAAEVGFEWAKVGDLLDKIEEEVRELRQELDGNRLATGGCKQSKLLAPCTSAGAPSPVEEEVGDLLFAVANLSRFLHFDAETCLRRANQISAAISGHGAGNPEQRQAIEGMLARGDGSGLDRSQESGIPVGYTVRVCVSHQDLAACVRIQQQVWGYSDAELYPVRLFVNLGQIGGHVIGAFAGGGELVGLVASMPAWRGRQRYLYSLMLGIVPGHENRGLGRALKLEQRSVALEAGIDRIEWSFDPLRARNAAFNINRLGAVVRLYEPDRYGPMEGRFHQGLPSDRLIAEWRLDSSRVRRALMGGQARNARRQPAARWPFPPILTP